MKAAAAVTLLLLLIAKVVDCGRNGSAEYVWKPEIVVRYHSTLSSCRESSRLCHSRTSSPAAGIFPTPQVIADVPSEFECFLGEGLTGSDNDISQNARDYSEPQDRRSGAVAGAVDVSATWRLYNRPRASNSFFISAARRSIENRARTRTQMAWLLLRRRRKTLSSAICLAKDVVRTSPTGRILENAAAALFCSGGAASISTEKVKSALGDGRFFRRRGNECMDLNGAAVGVVASRCILSEEERKVLVEKTSQLLSSVRRALDDETLWEPVAEKDGVKVWRTHADVKNLHAKGSACARCEGDGATIRSEAYLRGSPKEVYKLFMDNARVHEYNDNCVELQDIEHVDRSTKINWCATGRFGPFKARDFVTLVHYRELEKGEGYLSLAANVEHSKLPPAEGYVRSQIQLSATFMKPVPGDPKKTHFVQMTQVGQLGGVADSAVAKKITQNLSEKAPIEFVKKFDMALQNPPSSRPRRRSSYRLPFEGIGSLSEA